MYLPAAGRLFYLEPTGRRRSTDAVFFHGRPDYLGEQRFCQQTCFGMINRGGSNRAAVAINEVLPIFFTKSRCAAQLLENAECGINSLLAGFAAQFAQVF